MLGGKLVLVLEIRVLDVLGQPVLSKSHIFLRNRVGDPCQGLEEDIVLLLVSIGVTGLTASHELLLFIIKVIPVDISVLVEKINIGRIFSQLLHQIEKNDVLIIKACVLENKE